MTGLDEPNKSPKASPGVNGNPGMVIPQAFSSPEPVQPAPMMPEEIQKDVDTILKTMGLSDDENIHEMSDEPLPSPPPPPPLE